MKYKIVFLGYGIIFKAENTPLNNIKKVSRVYQDTFCSCDLEVMMLLLHWCCHGVDGVGCCHIIVVVVLLWQCVVIALVLWCCCGVISLLWWCCCGSVLSFHWCCDVAVVLLYYCGGVAVVLLYCCCGSVVECIEILINSTPTQHISSVATSSSPNGTSPHLTSTQGLLTSKHSFTNTEANQSQWRITSKHIEPP